MEKKKERLKDVKAELEEKGGKYCEVGVEQSVVVYAEKYERRLNCFVLPVSPL